MAATDLTLEFDLQGVSRGKDHLQRQWADFAEQLRSHRSSRQCERLVLAFHNRYPLVKSAEVVMERQASHQRCTNRYEEQTESHEMQAVFNGMLAGGLVCLMLLGQHKASSLLFASACSAVLGVVAELILAQLYLKLLGAPGLIDGECTVNGWTGQNSPENYIDTIVLGRAFGHTFLWADCIARAAPYVTVIFTGLAVAWHYPDNEVLFLACLALIWLLAYVFTLSALAKLLMHDR